MHEIEPDDYDVGLKSEVHGDFDTYFEESFEASEKKNAAKHHA